MQFTNCNLILILIIVPALREVWVFRFPIIWVNQKRNRVITFNYKIALPLKWGRTSTSTTITIVWQLTRFSFPFPVQVAPQKSAPGKRKAKRQLTLGTRAEERRWRRREVKGEWQTKKEGRQKRKEKRGAGGEPMKKGRRARRRFWVLPTMVL